MRTAEHITEILVYWDTSGNEQGWAELIRYDDGHEDSGPHDANDDDAVDLMVVEVANGLGLDIDEGAVAVTVEDGGCGHWMRPFEN